MIRSALWFTHTLKKYSRFAKNATIQESIIKRQGDFEATFGVVKTGQFTWRSVAS